MARVQTLDPFAAIGAAIEQVAVDENAIICSRGSHIIVGPAINLGGGEFSCYHCNRGFKRSVYMDEQRDPYGASQSHV